MDRQIGKNKDINNTNVWSIDERFIFQIQMKLSFINIHAERTKLVDLKLIHWLLRQLFFPAPKVVVFNTNTRTQDQGKKTPTTITKQGIFYGYIFLNSRHRWSYLGQLLLFIVHKKLLLKENPNWLRKSKYTYVQIENILRFPPIYKWRLNLRL